MSEPSARPGNPGEVEPFETQGYFSVLHTTPASAQTVRVYLGVVNERGLVLRRFTAVPHTSLVANAAAFNTFRPFLSTVKDGTATVRYLGAGRATAGYSLLINIPFRLHAEENFNEDLPVGALVGLDIVTTGTPDATRLLIQAGYIRTRR